MIGAAPRGLLWGFLICWIYLLIIWANSGLDVALEKNRVAIVNQNHFLELNRWFFIDNYYNKVVNAMNNLLVTVKSDENFQVAQKRLNTMGSKISEGSSWLSPLKGLWSNGFGTFFGVIKNSLLLAYNTLIFILLKLVEALFFLPAILLAIIMGIADGLIVGRNIRIDEQDSESTYRFHNFIKYLPWVVSTSLAVHLVLPFEIAPVAFCLALMMLAFFYSGMSIQRFKKKL